MAASEITLPNISVSTILLFLNVVTWMGQIELPILICPLSIILSLSSTKSVHHSVIGMPSNIKFGEKDEFIRINRSPVLHSWIGKLKLVLLSCTLQFLTRGLINQQLSGPFQNDKLVHALIEFKLSTYSLISWQLVLKRVRFLEQSNIDPENQGGRSVVQGDPIQRLLSQNNMEVSIVSRLHCNQTQTQCSSSVCIDSSVYIIGWLLVTHLALGVGVTPLQALLLSCIILGLFL